MSRQFEAREFIPAPRVGGLALPPRIYALPFSFAQAPGLAQQHLARIAAMGFDWVLFTPPPPVSPPAARDALSPIETISKAVREVGLRLMLRVDAKHAAVLPEWRKAGAEGFLLVFGAEETKAGRARFAPRSAELDGCLLVAEALGAPLDEHLHLTESGIGWFINSFAWWDYRQSWFLDQHQRMALQANTIATPEPWPGPRFTSELPMLDADLAGRIYAQRYLLAATVSSGVLCPFGFEFGLPWRIDDETVAAEEWEPRAEAPFNISEIITAINAVKASTPALAGEGILVRAAAPDADVIALARRATGNGPAMVAIANLEPIEAAFPPRAELCLGIECAPDFDNALPPHGSDMASALKPFESRLLVAASRKPKTILPAKISSDARLRTLAQSRIVIEDVSPILDGGRFPVKRVLGESLHVEADIFADGHDIIAAALCYRHPTDEQWQHVPMQKLVNDRWEADAPLTQIGCHGFGIEAWRDSFATWRGGLAKKLAAAQSVSVELAIGLNLLDEAASGAPSDVKTQLWSLYREAKAVADDVQRAALLMSDETAELMRRALHRENLTRSSQYFVVVDRPLAANAAWYEMFPRSASGDPHRHGTFDDVIARLPYVQDLGFDVLYFPPIHPIGKKNRKGLNNSLKAEPGDPGSPYAIGSPEGGHEAIHPELGTFEDFARLIQAAKAHGLEIALDFAIQCSPDHPWIKQHPEWFDWRPDGTIQFAENPPKKYEDIVPPHFYRDAFPSLWVKLRDIVLFWVGKGVKIFRVDNPHTKPVPFWEWLIGEVQATNPEVIFLAEAFTRPKMMQRLAKIGFTQSYSYFTWRNTKYELTEYLTELTQGESREYMRPNFFTNTPDINPPYLQENGRAGHQIRLVLAATLSPLYGIYNGFELAEATPIAGKEEYLDSEKYEIKAWDWDKPGNIKDDVRLINRIRRDNPALWHFSNLSFLNAWNDNILCYYKINETRDNLVIVAVTLDARTPQTARFEIPLWEFGLPDDASIEAVDLVHDQRFTWGGKMQTLWLEPLTRPYAIWRLVPPAAS